jgi:hypothetical protein
LADISKKEKIKCFSRLHTSKHYLGSFQNEDLSNSGTTRVTFRYLAIATMSHICIACSEVSTTQMVIAANYRDHSESKAISI